MLFAKKLLVMIIIWRVMAIFLIFLILGKPGDIPHISGDSPPHVELLWCNTLHLRGGDMCVCLHACVFLWSSRLDSYGTRLQNLVEVSFEIRLELFVPEHQSRFVSNIICSRSRRFQIHAETVTLYFNWRRAGRVVFNLMQRRSRHI